MLMLLILLTYPSLSPFQLIPLAVLAGAGLEGAAEAREVDLQKKASLLQAGKKLSPLEYCYSKKLMGAVFCLIVDCSRNVQQLCASFR